MFHETLPAPQQARSFAADWPEATFWNQHDTSEPYNDSLHCVVHHYVYSSDLSIQHSLELQLREQTMCYVVRGLTGAGKTAIMGRTATETHRHQLPCRACLSLTQYIPYCHPGNPMRAVLCFIASIQQTCASKTHDGSH